MINIFQKQTTTRNNKQPQNKACGAYKCTFYPHYIKKRNSFSTILAIQIQYYYDYLCTDKQISTTNHKEKF